jgi:hypothetical protein
MADISSRIIDVDGAQRHADDRAGSSKPLEVPDQVARHIATFVR